MDQNRNKGYRIAGAVACALLGLVLLLVGLRTLPASAAPAEVAVASEQRSEPHVQTADADCSISAVSPEECRALVALYHATGGSNWRESDGWLDFDGDAPCHWHGVTCDADRVVALALAGNRLRGAVPVPICALNKLGTIVDLGYNSLYTLHRNAAACLTSLDPDWRETQTVAPRDLTVAAFFTDALELAWTPILYSGDGGYYEVAYSIAASGPYTLHGRTDDKSATGYRLDGLQAGRTYYVRVRTHTPANTHLPEDLWSEIASVAGVTRAEETILLAVYFPADNDLSPYISSVVGQLRQGTALNPNVQVVFLADGRGTGNTALLTIRSGVVTPTNAVFAHWGTRELDTADPAVLTWFLQHARATYPAGRTVVSLMGHGLPMAPELVWPSSARNTVAATAGSQIPPLPQEWEDTPGDITSRSYMSILDIGQALAAATANGTQPFDLLFFDQCFQGNLDTLYEFQRAADVFVASSGYAWLAAPYARYMTQLTPTATAWEMARGIVEIYQNTLNNEHPNVIFAVRGVDISSIATAVSELGQALRQAVQDGDPSVSTAIDEAATASQYVDTNQCEQPEFTLGQPDELMGAGSFAANLQKAFAGDDAFGIGPAADKVLAALERVYSRARLGTPYLAPNTIWAYEDSLTILAPLGRDTSPEVAWRSTLYRESSGYTATWTLVPTQTVVVSGSLAFVRDGDWDDFLAAWYTSPMTPTVGPWCHYIPPAQVAVEEVEALSLTVQSGSAGANSVRLDWTEATDERATSYWIFVWGPRDVSWQVGEVLLDQTAYERSDLIRGEYHINVQARSDDGVFVARSNPVTWHLPPGLSPERRLFIPIVRR